MYVVLKVDGSLRVIHTMVPLTKGIIIGFFHSEVGLIRWQHEKSDWNTQVRFMVYIIWD